jgi:hypothetical protein
MTMSSRLPFPLFNSALTCGDTAFYPFTRLPKELRLLVWRHALQRERIVRLHLSDPDFEDPEIALQMIDHRRADYRQRKSSGRYNVTIQGNQILSKYLRISRESREETLAFYRIHLPCRFAQMPRQENDKFGWFISRKTLVNELEDLIVPGNFYFNSEWDVLHITCFPVANALIPPFVHDLRTKYDPRGVGLLNTLTDDSKQGGICETIRDLNPGKLSPPLQYSVGQTLRNLQELIIQTSTVCGRVSLGLFSNITSDTYFNRSVPITTKIPSFDRMSPDTRNISNDLARTFMGELGDWRAKFIPFTSLLSRFGLSTSECHTKFKLMLSINSYTEVWSREDAQLWLKKDCDMWWERPELWPPCDKSAFDGQKYIMDILPAFGFWLFSLERGKDMPQTKDVGIFDMRACVPELGLSYMPGE